MRLGIFGGTFDPVHYGHLLLAECCREQLALDRVFFVPAAMPPHKQGRLLTPGAQRAEMLELAIGGHEAFAVSRYEIDRGGLSYTVDTLAHFRAEQPAAELFFLMGADSLRDLPTWKDPGRLCQLAIPAIVARAPTDAAGGGSQLPDLGGLSELVPAERLEAIRSQQVEMPLVDFSASDIRRRVADGKSIRYRTPRAVEEYIKAQGLYRPAHAAAGPKN